LDPTPTPTQTPTPTPTPLIIKNNLIDNIYKNNIIIFLFYIIRIIK